MRWVRNSRGCRDGARHVVAGSAAARRQPQPRHGKAAEYFASGFEGMLILAAAVGIAVTAVQRLLQPQPLEQIGIGLVVPSSPR